MAVPSPAAHQQQQQLQTAYPDPRGLPTWYHGVLARKEAERLLQDAGASSGLFLLRASARELGYVLSLCQGPATIIHYQIRQEQGAEPSDEPYLTFDTDTGHAPRFRSLASVVHHLFRNPAHLPTPLVSWVERLDLVAPMPAPRYSLAQNKQAASADPAKAGPKIATSSTTTAIPETEDDNQQPVYETPTLDRQESQRRTSITCSLATFVKDTLAALDAPPNALTDDRLYATVQERVAHLKLAPQVQVYSAPKAGQAVFDARTGEALKLHAGEQLSLVSMMRDAKKRIMVVFKDGQERLLHVPLESEIQVVPSDIVVPSRSASVRDEPSKSATDKAEEEKASDASAFNTTGRRTANPKHGPRVSRNASLSEMVKSAGGKLELTAASGNPKREFFRDVIRQGYLSKLPPAGNRTQAWRKRYFKLVISLNRSMAGGPVFLEYYADHNKKQPKGVIDMDNVSRIGKPPTATLERGAVKGYKNVPHENIFELDMPKRTYRIMASSEAERDDWIATLKDIMGMDGKPLPDVEDFKPGETIQRTYHGVVLSRTLNNADGIVVLNDDNLTLTCPQTEEAVTVWHYNHLRGFGCVRNVCWVEASRHSPTGAGIFCFSTKQAETMFETLNRLTHSDSKNFRRRLSRRNNLTWASLGESLHEEALLEADLPAKTSGPQNIFGRALSAEDLEPVAVGVPRAAYKATRSEEYSFDEHETLRILACQSWVKEGFLLAQKPRKQGYGLVPINLVEVHEHEFGNLRDMDDFGGSQDSLMADVDVNTFAYPEENKSAPAPGVVDDTYDSPSAALREDAPGNGRAEHIPAN